MSVLRYWRGPSLALLGLLLLTAIPRADGPARPAGKVDFNRDVRPILTDACFACHGPDKAKRKADLRLDISDPMHKVNGIIIPGRSSASDLIKRITSKDPNDVMPPPGHAHQLKPEQIVTLTKWIDEGASYAQHWAYVVPKRPPLPKVKDTEWSRNAIDHFVLARLEAAGLSPAPEADKVALIRRVTFDLTGLPPTPSEVDAFLADTSPNAYAKVVTSLLESPRYGEHMGRFWLDLARFGDTHGMHLDNYREMWPYRDWVIRAFNRNLGYDQFIKAQLAGDMLPGNDLDNLVATGFNRAHVTTSEGGSITEEIHIRNVNDRVETTGTVLLGLTIGCARCHDHKFDPIAMKDFYALSAFFNSLEGSPLDGNIARHAPTVRVPTPAQAKALADVEKKLAEARKELTDQAAAITYDGKDDDKEAEQPKRGDFVWIDDAAPAGVKTTTDGQAKAWTFVKEPVHSGTLSLKHKHAGLGQHVLEGAKPGLKLGDGDKLFAYVYLDPTDPPKQIMLQFHTGGWSHRAYWGDSLIPFGTENTPDRKRSGELPEKGKWVRLEVPLAHVGLKAGDTINGWAFTQHGGTVYWDKAGLNTQIPQSGGSYDTLSSWVRVQRATKGAGLPGHITAIVNLERDKRKPEQTKQLQEYFVQNVWSKTQTLLAPARSKIGALEKERTKLEETIPVTYVFRDVEKPVQAYMLKRGEYDQRGDKVDRAVPGFLHKMPDKAPKNRLGLAEWVLDDKNPLTARVAVNRFWQQVFGTGLVKTAEDFGIQGETPTHPELLDWLAIEFRESGWDVKQLMKLIVTSRTYRQSSKLTKEKQAKDRDNRLLSRGSRFRLDAEMLRDQALAASGLLVEKLGGPSVKPPQPPGLWKAVAFVGSNTMNFVADKGADKVHRRSLYTFWKRTSPPPQMSTFDAPSREACTARRERTNTPLQALLLLNETQYVEAARALAERVLKEGGDCDEDRLAYLFRLTTCRRPDAKELVELSAALKDLRAEYGRDEAAAKKLIAIGESKADAKLPPAELAAWAMLASTVLNLDEVLNKG